MHLIKIAVRFSSKESENLFIRLVPQAIQAAKNYSGLIAVDFWRNLADPDLLMDDSYWVDESSADAWRRDPFHQHLQKLGSASLIMESTTTRWDMKGEMCVYHKCPVCGTAGTFKTALTDWSFATREPTRCKTCGYVLPVALEFSDAVARSCLMNRQ